MGCKVEGVVQFLPSFFRGVFSHLREPSEFRKVMVVECGDVDRRARFGAGRHAARKAASSDGHSVTFVFSSASAPQAPFPPSFHT